MTTSIATITPQNAPRDVPALVGIGIFRIRQLLETLNALQTEEQKLAFSRMSAEQKGQYAAQCLAQWDAQNPGGATAAPPPPPPPMPVATNGHMNGNGIAGHAAAAPMQQMPLPQATMQPPQVAQVDPAALAAAQTAAAGGARKPRTKTEKTDAGGDDLGPQVLQLLGTIATQQQQLQSGIVQSYTSMSEALTAHKEHMKNLDVTYAGVYETFTEFDRRLEGIQNGVSLSIAISCMLAEQALGASREEILQMAVKDIGHIKAMISPPAKK